MAQNVEEPVSHDMLEELSHTISEKANDHDNDDAGAASNVRDLSANWITQLEAAAHTAITQLEAAAHTEPAVEVTEEFPEFVNYPTEDSMVMAPLPTEASHLATSPTGAEQIHAATNVQAAVN